MRRYKPRDATPLGHDGTVEYQEQPPVGLAVHVVTIGTPEWLTYLKTISAFAYKVGDIFFSVKRYPRSRGTGYWTAYKAVHGNTHKFYIGNDDKVTVERLDEIANELFYVIAHPDTLYFRPDGLVKRPKRIKD